MIRIMQDQNSARIAKKNSICHFRESTSRLIDAPSFARRAAPSRRIGARCVARSSSQTMFRRIAPTFATPRDARLRARCDVASAARSRSVLYGKDLRVGDDNFFRMISICAVCLTTHVRSIIDRDARKQLPLLRSRLALVRNKVTLNCLSSARSRKTRTTDSEGHIQNGESCCKEETGQKGRR